GVWPLGARHSQLVRRLVALAVFDFDGESVRAGLEGDIDGPVRKSIRALRRDTVHTDRNDLLVRFNRAAHRDAALEMDDVARWVDKLQRKRGIITAVVTAVVAAVVVVTTI